MTALPALLAAGICFSTMVFSAWSVMAAHRLFRRPVSEDPLFRPPVSILIPLCGTQPDAFENLASFCRQDYPKYQLLFCVRNEQDPSVTVVQRLIRSFPERDIALVVARADLGSNPKVSNLSAGEARARYSVWVICDSDIRVEPDYLGRVVDPLRDPGVGAVTCMCRSLSKGWVGRLEALRESTEFCPGVLVAWMKEGIRFALGSTVVVRREALDKIGGLVSIADYLADDFMLGKKISEAGFSIVLSPVVVEHSLANRRFTSLARRQLRWNRGIRVSRPWGYRGLLLTYGVPAALLWAIFSRGSSWGVLFLGLTVIARLGVAYEIGVRCLRDRTVGKFLWAVPLQDLVSFVFWCGGLTGSSIDWRGQRFTLTPGGKLISRAAPVRRVEPHEDAAALTS